MEMSSRSRSWWRVGLITSLPLLAVMLALYFTFSALFLSHAAGVGGTTQPLRLLSTDPYTNPDSQHKTQVEPDTFAFGNTEVAVFQSGRFFDGGASNIGFATSTDGGKTFVHGFLPGTTVFATPAGPARDHRTSDPSVAYDARHQVWIVSYLAFFSGTSVATDVLASRSTDGGLTWGLPVVVNRSGHSNDKSWTVCDDTSSSPFYGNCYTEFDNFSSNNLVQMSTSTDGGKTWGPAQTTPDHACVIGGQPLVQPSGTVIVPIDDCSETAVLAFRSTDGGKSWSRVVLAAQILSALDPGRIRSGPLPSAEIDQSGRIYVTWEDCRFEPGCRANDLVLITSTDGRDWTLPKRIPIDPVGSGVDHFLPGLAVDRTTSDDSAHLGLAFYYYPNVNCGTMSTPACQLDVGFISSTNGGASWSNKEQLAGPMKLAWLANTSQGRMVGDYISTSIVPGDDNATAVFEVAFPPTGAAACGLGVVCHENTYTAQDDLLKIVGGNNVAGSDPVLHTSLHALPKAPRLA
jgi:hypothetical protein